MPFEPVHDSIERATSVIYGTRYSKEMAKWNKPWLYVPYPAMLYKARKYNDQGAWKTHVPEPQREAFPTDQDWRRAQELAERFTASCQRIVNSKEEAEAAYRDGWRPHPKEAVDFMNGLDDDIAKAAAYRAYEDRNMSEKAKAEIAQAEAESDGMHVAEVVEKPKARRGRPRKDAA